MALDRAARLLAAVERDGPTCIWCGRAFTAQVAPSTEHVVPRVKGGPSWLENEVAACRGATPSAGTPPGRVAGGVRPPRLAARRARLARVLTALAGAIAVRGGQRRARPYLDAQLRRLGRRGDARPA